MSHVLKRIGLTGRNMEAAVADFSFCQSKMHSLITQNKYVDNKS